PRLRRRALRRRGRRGHPRRMGAGSLRRGRSALARVRASPGPGRPRARPGPRGTQLRELLPERRGTLPVRRRSPQRPGFVVARVTLDPTLGRPGRAAFAVVKYRLPLPDEPRHGAAVRSAHAPAEALASPGKGEGLSPCRRGTDDADHTRSGRLSSVISVADSCQLGNG